METAVPVIEEMFFADIEGIARIGCPLNDKEGVECRWSSPLSILSPQGRTMLEYAGLPFVLLDDAMKTASKMVRTHNA